MRDISMAMLMVFALFALAILAGCGDPRVSTDVGTNDSSVGVVEAPAVLPAAPVFPNTTTVTAAANQPKEEIVPNEISK